MKVSIAPITLVVLATLLVIDIGLGISLFAGDADQISTGAERAEWSVDLSVPSDSLTAKRSAELYRETLARPVFFKTRLPYVPPIEPDRVPTASIAAPVNPGLVVTGVMIRREVKKAYLMTKDESQGTWVQEGEVFRGWRIKSVDRDGVKLEQQNQIIELLLYVKSKS